jgi:hypothetical protein
MEKIFFITLLLMTQTSHGAQNLAKKPASLKYSLEFLLDKVLEIKHFPKNNSIPLPKLFVESKTPLTQFQEAIEPQWGFKPDVFSNAFAIHKNEIYITDDAAYYKKHDRCIDDSVVHELVHYYQTKYRGWDINDESLEWDAIEIQTQFRNEFCPIN